MSAGWVAAIDPNFGNDVHVKNEAGRMMALFYREYDANGGTAEAMARAQDFLAISQADGELLAFLMECWSVDRPTAIKAAIAAAAAVVAQDRMRAA